MTSADRIWMTRRAYIRLQAELAALQARPRLEVPDDAVAEPGMVVTVRYDDIGETHGPHRQGAASDAPGGQTLRGRHRFGGRPTPSLTTRKDRT
ncbi:hypothetical protein [Mycobacterium sp. 1164985.4]|uniref:hypothetical protein n=1 Tax=Mycobacterium sp. 1164985.4 TaxID=1834069 RepID=UPI0007FFF232|nr:hypothetical protein [Mycobacterium sp. 1164985.4]OBK79892.1 hypothetical protein A5650_06575 [Mycobacterium sp. 1164985.4]